MEKDYKPLLFCFVKHKSKELKSWPMSLALPYDHKEDIAKYIGINLNDLSISWQFQSKK